MDKTTEEQKANSITLRNEQKCLLCDNVKLKHDTQRGYQATKVYDIYNCDRCNTSFSSPRTDTQELYDSIYRNGSSVPGYNRYYFFSEQVLKEKKPINFLADQEPTYWGILQSLSNLNISLNEQIIEIGSGLGYLTYSLRKTGYTQIMGLDISEDAVIKAKQRYGDFYQRADIYNFTQSNKGRYKVVILTEVIEHLEDVVSFMTQLTLLLQEDGYILLTTPNKSFYPKDEVWETENPPVHCWWLSEDSIKQLAEVTNLNVTFLNFSPYYKNRVPSYVKLGQKRNNSYILDAEGNLLRKARKKRKRPYCLEVPYRAYHRIRFTLLKIMGVKYAAISGERTWTLCAQLSRK